MIYLNLDGIREDKHFLENEVVKFEKMIKNTLMFLLLITLIYSIVLIRILI
jgi:hypothetical protein